MKVVGLRVVAAVVNHQQVIHGVFPDAVVVGLDKEIKGTMLRVVRNTVWYTRAVAVAVMERLIETCTQGTPGKESVMLRATADAVVRVLCLSKRTLRLQTVRIRRSSRSGTRVEEVYHRP